MPSDVILTTAAVITALGIIIGAVLATYRLARRIGDAIGVDRNGRTLADRLDRVEHQLWENGGSSLADRVNSIERSTTEASAEMRIIKEILIGMPSYVPVEQQKTTTRRRKKPDNNPS
jgi:hypothetical protein